MGKEPVIELQQTLLIPDQKSTSGNGIDALFNFGEEALSRTETAPTIQPVTIENAAQFHTAEPKPEVKPYVTPVKPDMGAAEHFASIPHTPTQDSSALATSIDGAVNSTQFEEGKLSRRLTHFSSSDRHVWNNVTSLRTDTKVNPPLTVKGDGNILTSFVTSITSMVNKITHIFSHRERRPLAHAA